MWDLAISVTNVLTAQNRGADMSKHKAVFDEDHAFMLGGELAFYNVVEGAVLLYSNAIEPWGVRVHVDPVDLVAVEHVARHLYRVQWGPDVPFV